MNSSNSVDDLSVSPITPGGEMCYIENLGIYYKARRLDEIYEDTIIIPARDPDYVWVRVHEPKLPRPLKNRPRSDAWKTVQKNRARAKAARAARRRGRR